MSTIGDARDERRQKHDERLLLQFHKTGNESIREQVVERFMPLARSLALRYRGGGEPVEDLVQVASVGLLKAIDRYEPGRGPTFAAYATPTILGELRHHFRDRSWTVRLPRSLQERSVAITEAEAQLRGELRRPPSIEEVAQHCGLDPEQVIEAMQADQARRTASLDRPKLQDEGESIPVIETISTTDPGFDRAESELAGDRAELRVRERRALHLRFHRGLTQREIGDELGVSQMQVSRLLRSALTKLLTAIRGGEEIDPERVTAEPDEADSGPRAAA